MFMGGGSGRRYYLLAVVQVGGTIYWRWYMKALLFMGGGTGRRYYLLAVVHEGVTIYWQWFIGRRFC